MNKINLQDWNVLNQGLKLGEHFVVRNNVLEKRTGFWASIKYYFVQKREDAAVREKVSETVGALVREASNYSDDEKEELRQVFFEKLAVLPANIFDRRAIGRDKAVGKQFALMLDPNLAQTERKLEDPALERQRKLDRRIEKVRLAVKLGVELVPISEGTNGSYFARDYKSKILGVFKPGQEESNGGESPKLMGRIAQWMTKHLVSMENERLFWVNEGYLAESMTSRLAERLGIDIVPSSTIATLESRAFEASKKEQSIKALEGSFQLFVKGSRSAEQALKLDMGIIPLTEMLLKFSVWRNKNHISASLKLEQFEEMALIDVLICNKDRHFRNWLVKKTDRGGKYDIFLIDHQLGFPKTNPSKGNILFRRNQYKWAAMPQAEKPFSKGIIAKTRPQLKGEALKQLIQDLCDVTRGRERQFNAPEGESSQEIAFKQRVAVLLVLMDYQIPLRELEVLKSQEEIEEFLGHYNVPIQGAALDRYLEI